MSQSSRPVPGYTSDERAMLTEWLDFHRATLERKCQDLPAERLKERSAPPSGLSLLGLVRHLADVERYWFRVAFLGENVPPHYYSIPDNPDGDFDDIADADPQEAFAMWRRECDLARSIVAAAESVDATGAMPADSHAPGEKVSLRWILVHMIEEYARHNGHADLIRERIDGVAGV